MNFFTNLIMPVDTICNLIITLRFLEVPRFSSDLPGACSHVSCIFNPISCFHLDCQHETLRVIIFRHDNLLIYKKVAMFRKVIWCYHLKSSLINLMFDINVVAGMTSRLVRVWAEVSRGGGVMTLCIKIGYSKPTWSESREGSSGLAESSRVT